MDYRQKIAEKAAQMFLTYGIRAVTMDMLASHMGISKRTIYEIFSDKDELLTVLLKWMAERQNELIKKVFSESENVIESIFIYFELMDEHFSSMSPAFKLDMEKYHNDIIRMLRENDEIPYYNNNAEIIRRGISEGVFRSDIDVNITNKCFYEVIRMSLDKDNLDSADIYRKDVLRDLYINYLRGIATSRGLDLIDFYRQKRKQQKITTQKNSL